MDLATIQLTTIPTWGTEVPFFFLLWPELNRAGVVRVRDYGEQTVDGTRF